MIRTAQGQLSRQHIEAVKTWVRDALCDSGLTVLVTELRCAKTECPTVETVIGVVEKGKPRRWSIPRPLGELRREDVVDSVLHEAAPQGAPSAQGRG